MKPERFYTEARLLSSTRADGHQASALDNGNTYQYVTGVGWVQLLPSSGVEGQALVVGPTELTSPDVPGPIRHRSRIEFGSHNKFVPEDGSEGQVASIDEEGETVLAAPTFAAAESGITYPLNFAAGGALNFVNRVIPGGALGPNGFLRVTAFGVVITNASKTITFAVTSPGVVNGLQMTLSSNANYWAFEYSYLVQNTNDEGDQTASNSLKHALYLSGATTSSSWDENFQAGLTGSGVDTAVDWTLNGQITTAAITGAAEVTGCVVEYGYIP